MTKTVTVQAQQKWEYCMSIRRSETALLVEINEFGDDGWELIHVEYFKDPKGVMTWAGFLKRPGAGQTGQPAPQASQPAAQDKAQPVAKPAEKPKEAPAASTGFDLSDGDFDFKEE